MGLDYATFYANEHPDGAVELCGVHYHLNEITFSHATDPATAYAICKEGCGWETPLDDLPRDGDGDGDDENGEGEGEGMIRVPPLCPECWKADEVSGVSTVYPDAKPSGVEP